MHGNNTIIAHIIQTKPYASLGCLTKLKRELFYESAINVNYIFLFDSTPIYCQLCTLMDNFCFK